MRTSTLALVLCSMLAAAPATTAADRSANLGLRPTPRILHSAGEVLLMAQLAGGGDVEELHCPRIVWDFGDGSVSAHESDCEPWSEGTRIERFFQTRHFYGAPGEYQVKAALWRGEKKIRQAQAVVLVAGQ